MSLYGLEISEEAGILSSEHRQRQRETVCWEHSWFECQCNWLRKLNKLLIPLPLMALDSFRQKVYCAIVDLSILFCIFQCVNTLFAMPRTHRDWKLRLSGCCGKPEQSLPYLRIIFNANNSHRTTNMKGSRSPPHSPIYGRVCNIDMDDIICGFNWSIT